jgi:hypothetical protein
MNLGFLGEKVASNRHKIRVNIYKFLDVKNFTLRRTSIQELTTFTLRKVALAAIRSSVEDRNKILTVSARVSKTVPLDIGNSCNCPNKLIYCKDVNCLLSFKEFALKSLLIL